MKEMTRIYFSRVFFWENNLKITALILNLSMHISNTPLPRKHCAVYCFTVMTNGQQSGNLTLGFCSRSWKVTKEVLFNACLCVLYSDSHFLFSTDCCMLRCMLGCFCRWDKEVRGKYCGFLWVDLPLPAWLHKQCVKLSGEYKLRYQIRMCQD